MIKRRFAYAGAIAVAVFILDQLTKWWVMASIPYGSETPVIRGFFDIIHTRNTGAAFGLLSGADSAFRVPFFYIIAAVAAVVIVLVLWKIAEDRATVTACALVLGGIAGNIVDRMRIGSVVDFLSFHIRDEVFSQTLLGYHITFPLSWPAFNVADMAITAAVFLLLVGGFAKKTVVGGE